MIPRHLAARLQQSLKQFPVVALLGPRQVGKTTLARDGLRRGAGPPPLYLDLERATDRNKLADPESYLARFAGQLVILDEIQRLPEIFPLLRSLVDERRRAGERAGQFLVLGSASRDLLRQPSESLAGRIVYHELTPITVLEAPRKWESLWVRGGFPESLLAKDDGASWRWRSAFIDTYLERDIPELGPRVPALQMRRLWSMLAHGQGDQLNLARLAAALGLTGKTVRHYLDILTELFMVRQLPPWSGNSKKRLVRSPKVYLRDSGLAHTLANVPDLETLLGHPLCGHSWEGFVLEQIVAGLPDTWEASYYRTSAQAEIDLVLTGPRGRVLAIEIKRSSAPTPGKGFLLGCQDVRATERFIVKPTGEAYSVGHEVETVSLVEFLERRAPRVDASA